MDDLNGDCQATEANVVGSKVTLEVSEDRVTVEIDGIRGEVTMGQARQVREQLAEYAIGLIRETTRQRRLEAQMIGDNRFVEVDAINRGQLARARFAQRERF